MVKNYFKLEKLKIQVYNDKARSGKPEDSFQVMFNPESYSLKYKNVYQAYQGINTSGREARYSLSKPQELSLKLIFDNSGVYETLPVGIIGAASSAVDGIKNKNRLSQAFIDAKDRNSVYKKVNKFLELTNYMDGSIHQPKFLKVEWGDLIFDCRLESVDIKYTLFNRSGQPIRAELDTKFVGDIQDSKRIRKEKKSSPDLTHQRTIHAQDKLPLMAHKIYNTPDYYIELARANKLNNFRKLRVGEIINFPPVREL